MKVRLAFVLTLVSISLASSSIPAHCERVTTAMNARGADKRAASSIGESIRAAETIVFGTFEQPGQFKVSEVLKGDRALLGHAVNLSPQRGFAFGFDPCLAPPGSRYGAAILLAPGWQKSPQIVEQFTTADQISRLRCLVPIYALSGERERFKKLSELCVDPAKHCQMAFGGDPKPMFRKEFYAAIQDMRDPANFEIVTALYSQVDTEAQINLLAWMADTRDLRCLPLLLTASHSPDDKLRGEAIDKLIRCFPDQKGVREVMEKVLRGTDAANALAVYQYLKFRHADVSGAAIKVPEQTAFQMAEQLSDSGKFKEAVPLYFEALESKKSDPYLKRTAALRVLKEPNRQQKERIMHALLPLLKHDATDGNYLEVADAATILRGLHEPSCLDSLIKIGDRREFVFRNANRTATLAIVDLGAAARATATRHLLDQVESSPGALAAQEAKTILLLELAFIVDSESIARCEKVIAAKPDWRGLWSDIRPLAAVSDKKDQGTFLTELLRRQPPLPADALAWVVFRLGDLRDKNAAELIANYMVKGPYDLASTAAEALKAIGVDGARSKLEEIAIAADGQNQQSAIDALCTAYGAQELPFLRRIINGGSLPGKPAALLWMGKLGTVDDLRYLVPMNDYWTGDRANHYWLSLAIGGIQDRHGSAK